MTYTKVRCSRLLLISSNNSLLQLRSGFRSCKFNRSLPTPQLISYPSGSRHPLQLQHQSCCSCKLRKRSTEQLTGSKSSSRCCCCSRFWPSKKRRQVSMQPLADSACYAVHGNSEWAPMLTCLSKVKNSSLCFACCTCSKIDHHCCHLSEQPCPGAPSYCQQGMHADH